MDASELQLYVFGGLRARLGGLALEEVLSQKALALLCYLAVERREHSRSTLATLLWGEFPESDAATNLRQALSHLRRALDPYLVVSRHTVRLNPDSPMWLESDVFERHLAAATREPEADHLEAAISLYGGDFLQGFTLRDAPAFDEWAVLRRERFHARALTALQTLADRVHARGDYAAAITYTARLLALDPWREEAHWQLMWLYVRTGQRSAALAQYQSCRRILEQELGVEPMVRTTDLYEQIKAAQAMAPPPIVLPATPFVGRTAERAELGRRVADPALRLLTIAGPGGIGKTRLALQVASEWAARFLHGARFVELASVTTADALDAALMSALDPGPRGSNDPRLQLRSFLAGKDLLLVLDNFEQLVDRGADVLVDILRHAPEVKLLVTSRERLQLRDEWLLELAGLDVPVRRAAEIENYGAVELFVESARKLRPDFALSEADKPAVARICRLVEGTPLAIELAVAWTRVLSPEEIARELEQSLELLTTSLRDLPARHRSLRAVFDHSWRLLTPEEQCALRRLATFRGGFSRDAARQVGTASPALLAALLDKSLLYGRPGPAPVPRYDMHEMVRHYARQKLDQAGELPEIQARHLQFFLELAENTRPRLIGSEQKLALDLLEREHDNFRAALEVALDRRLEEQGVRLAGALWRFWWTRGHLEEGCRWLRQVLRMQEEAMAEERACAQASMTSGPGPIPALA
ncbi:MAG TPA: BTAD domain-containing putative transcriptional regulator, partial [Herpetosiphonaceae bacterium]|nr:BTAD domain-containing putative transcriptional regulator [Herpetosiphonaceae bacterium]